MSNTEKGNNNVRFIDVNQEQRWWGVMPAVPSKGHTVRFHNRSGMYRVSEVVWNMHHYGCNVSVYVEEV